MRFFNRPTVKLFKQANTYISENVKLTGDIEADADITIDGEMHGSIKSSKHVMLGATARFEGTIESESALICGYVNGRVVTRTSLEVKLPATVIGDLVSASVRVDSGVIIQGKVYSQPVEYKTLPSCTKTAADMEGAHDAEVVEEEKEENEEKKRK